MLDLEATRLSLHAVAELLLAGPQYDVSRTLKLRVTPGGFGTVTSPSARVEGTTLIIGERPLALDGRTISAVAVEAGLPARPLADLYSGGPASPSTTRSRSTEPRRPRSPSAFASAPRRWQPSRPTPRRCCGPSTSTSASRWTR